MITHRFWLGVVAFFYTIGALFVAQQIAVQGLDFMSALKVLAVLSPFLLILMNMAAPLWVSFALTTALLTGLALPIPLLDRVNIGLAMGAGITVFIVAQNAINKTYPVGIFNQTSFRWLMFFFVIVWMRFLIDRPGSARLGTAGGLGEALPIALSGFVFMAMAITAQREWPAKTNLIIIVLMGLYGIAMQINGIITYFLSGMRSVPPNCFNPVTWTGFAFLGGLIWVWSRKAARRSFLAYWSIPFFVATTMLFGFLSAQRSRPYYALAIILAIAYLMKSFRRVVLALCVLVIPVFFTLAYLAPSMLPGAMLRSLSTLVPGIVSQELANRQYVGDIARGEIGWQNEWRSTLTRLAWEDVKTHPLLGRGFNFSLDQILGALMAQGRAGEGMIQGLAVSGGYHNGLMTIASFCGIPAALAFLLGNLWIYLRFLRQVRRMDNSDFWGKAMVVGLAAAFLPNFWQMAINGSGPQIFTCLVYCGVMYGLSYRFSQQQVVLASVAEPARISRVARPIAPSQRALELSH
jgi:hypothetical protein